MRLALLLAVMVAAISACHQDQTQYPSSGPGQQVSENNFPPPNPDKNAYFGDLHLHTRMSFDAYQMQTDTMPEDSYRFAMGEAVSYLGQTVQRHVPLDFLAVTDHAEYLGIQALASDPNGPFSKLKVLEGLSSAERTSHIRKMIDPSRLGLEPPVAEFHTPEMIQTNWQRVIDAAEKYYRPGKFTTFVGYEWTSMPDSNNLHRNVIFRGPKYPSQPFSTLDSSRPEALWAYADHNRSTGIDSVIIPHNSNLSAGLMFDMKDSNGDLIDGRYAETRSRNERIVEIAQTKGTSETRPELSPEDEFSNFELYPLTSLSGVFRPQDFSGGFVRSAYERGLEIQKRTGVNPYDFGIVAGTDFHSGVSATEENNYPGSHGVSDTHREPGKALYEEAPRLKTPTNSVSAGALTGVWAEQNTRVAIFNALKRRETFATSGDRIKVRLFAGWNYPRELLTQPDWVRQAYAEGVPQGSYLPANPTVVRSPTFIVDAVKDPDSGNLDRIQIIKIWYVDGKAHEKVFDAVWSGARKPDPSTGKLPPVGNTVDVRTATYTNTIGASELLGSWTDPEFNPKAPANYYARVLEIPTPRWSTYLAANNHMPLPNNVAAFIQERAWTSPVFYVSKYSNQ